MTGLLIVLVPNTVAGESSLQDRLESMLQVYPSGSYFSQNGSACIHDAYHTCVNCCVHSVPSRGGLPAGNAVGADKSWTCNGFAKYAFYCLNGISFTQAANDAKKENSRYCDRYTGIPYQQVFEYAAPGDLVSYKGHVGIFICGDADGYYMYEANYYTSAQATTMTGTNRVSYCENQHRQGPCTILHVKNRLIAKNGRDTDGQYAISEHTEIWLEWEDDSFLDNVSSVTLSVYRSSVQGGESYLCHSEEIAIEQGSRPSAWIQNTEAGYYTAYFHVGKQSSLRTSWVVRDLRTVVSSSHGSNAVVYQTTRYDGQGNFLGYGQTVEHHFVTGEPVRLSLNTSEFSTAYLVIYMSSGYHGTVFEGWVNPNDFEFVFDERANYQCAYYRIGPYEMATEQISIKAENPFDFNVNASLNGSTVSLSWPDMGVDMNGRKGYSIYATLMDPDNNISLSDWSDQLSAQIQLPAAGLWDVEVSLFRGPQDVLIGRLFIVIDAVTVSFDSNGGTGAPLPQALTQEAGTILPEGPTRPGYEFMGWSIMSGTASPSYQPGDTYSGEEDVTLYAVWEKPSPDFILPEGTVTVEDNAFQGCAFIFAKLSESTEIVGDGAFAGCRNLRHVQIPPTTVEIGSNVFPDGVTIHGQAGSFAAFYAESNGFSFAAE